LSATRKCSSSRYFQVGPIVDVHLPKDKISGAHQSYGFVEFRSEDDAEYAVKVLSMTKLFSKPLRVTKASSDRARVDVGANLFIGNLAPEVDEKVLYDTFSAFGVMVMPPKVMRDPESGVPKGFGFVNFDSFESSDMAIECMSGQFMGSRQVVAQYAFKRDVPGERHGGMAERLLAATRPRTGSSAARPHTLFAAAPGQVSSIVPATSMIGQNSNYGAVPPQMLPPAAILPASLAPPPLPPQAPYQPTAIPGGPPPLPPANSFSMPPPMPNHLMYGNGPMGFAPPPPLPPLYGGPQMMGMLPPPLPPGMYPPPPMMMMPPPPPGMMMPPPLPMHGMF
jgi:splicing factor 3B subunit 4